MNKQLNKQLIPLVRKMMPGIIAAQIVGVQPMLAPVGEIFTLRTKYNLGWSSWKKTFLWWPKRSITGALIVGWVNVSGRQTYVPRLKEDTNSLDTQYRWATNKEIFKMKLEGKI